MNRYISILLLGLTIALFSNTVHGQCDYFSATASGIQNASCFGSGTGSATITGSNGTAPYIYSLILNGSTLAGPSSTSVFNGLVSGNYSFIVTDNTGCIYEGSFQILQPDDPQVFISGLVTSYCQDGEPAVMFGTPSGGQFSGVGVNGNTFDPSLAGQGFHRLIQMGII